MVEEMPANSGFCELIIGLQAPYLSAFTVKTPKVSGTCRNILVFGRPRPETGFNLHCVADITRLMSESGYLIGMIRDSLCTTSINPSGIIFENMSFLPA